MRGPGRAADVGAVLVVAALLPGPSGSTGPSEPAGPSGPSGSTGRVDRAGPATTAFVLQDPAITESSGLVHTGAHVLTVNDSGDGPVVYVLDPQTGATVGRTTYSTGGVVDVEALALGPGGDLWVGDIGDNPGTRAFISLYRLPVPTPGDRTVSAQRFDLVYRGGPRDAEALLVHPRTGRVHVVSKSVLDGQVFAAPRELRPGRPAVLEPVGRAGAVVTDAVAHPDGRHALLRSYGALWLVETATWSRLGLVRLPAQDQGEGLALVPGAEEVLLSTEGARSAVLRLPLPRALLPAAPAPTGTSEPGSPTPSSSPAAPADGAAGPRPGDGLAGLAERPGLLAGGAGALAGAVLLALLWWQRRGVRGARRRSRSTG